MKDEYPRTAGLTKQLEDQSAMKKLLGSTLALALLVPAFANAELLKNFKASGSIDIDAISANNVNDLNTATYDHVNTVQTRVLVNGDWDLLDDVHSKVTLRKNNRTYGNASENIGSGAGGVQANTFLDQANVKIDKLFGAIDATLGRQFYGEAGDLVIYFGPRNDYSLSVTALDAGRFDWNGENVGVTVLGAKLPAASALGSKDTGDQNLWGVDVHVKANDSVGGSVYGWSKTTINSGGATNGVVGNDKLFVVGAKAKATMGGAWIKAEIAKNFGVNRVGVAADGRYAFAGNFTGTMAHLNAGAKADVNNVGALTGWADAGIGSGGATGNRSFQAIAGDYRPGGIAGRFWTGNTTTLELGSTSGLSSTVGTGSLSNRVNIGAGVKATPAALAKLTAGLSWWNYRVQNAAGLPAAAKGNKFIGNEYDLDLNWAHSENVSVSAGVGSFQPGRMFIAAQSAISPAHLCYADFNVKF